MESNLKTPVERAPDDGFKLKRASADPAVGAELFAEREPELNDALTLVMDGIGAGLIPEHQQRKLWDELSPNLRREIVAREGSLDANTLSTFKQQMRMVNGIMSQLFTPDGTPMPPGEGGIGMSHKDAMTLWMKLNQMMTRDMPKIINMERFQRLESALFQVMEETMTPDQQAMVLARLEKSKSTGK